MKTDENDSATRRVGGRWVLITKGGWKERESVKWYHYTNTYVWNILVVEWKN